MKRMRYIYEVTARASSRELEPCYRSSSGIASVRNDLTVEYESGLERDFLIQASAHKDFLTAKWNPIELHYVDSIGRSRIYTPDCLIEHSLGSEMPNYWLVELKYRADLRENLHKLRDGFYAARQYARSIRGWRFSVLTERSINDQYVENILHLNRYQEIPIDSETSEFAEHLFFELRGRGTSTPQHLLAACYSNREDQLRAIPTLWAMVRKGIIRSDLRRKLTMSAPIWVAQ